MRTRGFTLVELLVVVTIIGILIALLLPAVQAAREAARRGQCTNQLKQLGLALHNYHNTHQVMPPGLYNLINNWSTLAASERIGWFASILPFVEQEALYDLWVSEFKKGVNGLNFSGRNTVVSSFVPRIRRARAAPVYRQLRVVWWRPGMQSGYGHRFDGRRADGVVLSAVPRAHGRHYRRDFGHLDDRGDHPRPGQRPGGCGLQRRNARHARIVLEPRSHGLAVRVVATAQCDDTGRGRMVVHQSPACTVQLLQLQQ